MPVNANIGWISYALVAIVGAILGINDWPASQSGTVVTFVGIEQKLYEPDYAGKPADQFRGERLSRRAASVFNLMDQEPEKNEGYVELVNREGG